MSNESKQIAVIELLASQNAGAAYANVAGLTWTAEKEEWIKARFETTLIIGTAGRGMYVQICKNGDPVGRGLLAFCASSVAYFICDIERETHVDVGDVITIQIKYNINTTSLGANLNEGTRMTIERV